jgi:hypothetical protein
VAGPAWVAHQPRLGTIPGPKPTVGVGSSTSGIGEAVAMRKLGFTAFVLAVLLLARGGPPEEVLAQTGIHHRPNGNRTWPSPNCERRPVQSPAGTKTLASGGAATKSPSSANNFVM